MCYYFFMQRVLGVPVPDSVVKVQIRAYGVKKGRPRVIYAGEIEDIEPQDIIDRVASDRGFWEWVSGLLRAGRLTGPEQSETSVTLHVSCAFLYQDGNFAIIDPGTGQTSFTFPEPWEFLKSSSGRTEQESIVAVVDRLAHLVAETNRTLVDQNKSLPDVLARMLKDVSEQGRASTVSATEQSAKLLASMVEPLKAQLTLIDRHSSNETERANKSTDAVIRSLNAESSGAKDPRGEEEKFLDTMERGWRFIKTVTS
jgi:hypothetical protein